MTNACLPRSPKNLIDAIDSVKLETTPDLQPNFGGQGWTHCNLAVVRMLSALTLSVPLKLANDLQGWFLKEGQAQGWREVGIEEAIACANRGEPVVGSYLNPIGHGHVVLLRPTPDKDARCAQAGRRNFSNGTLAAAMGGNLRNCRFFAHL